MADSVHDASSSLAIAAPPETVWHALTDPASIEKFFLGSKVETTWEVGTPITYSGEWNGKPYRDVGTILEVEPPRLLRTTHYSPLTGLPDAPENYHTVEYRVDPDGDGSRVTITQGNNRSDDEVPHAEENWALVLGNLKTLIEG
jgi:uncharacterized protein YndB with AHSA1/START domain